MKIEFFINHIFFYFPALMTLSYLSVGYVFVSSIEIVLSASLIAGTIRQTGDMVQLWKILNTTEILNNINYGGWGSSYVASNFFYIVQILFYIFLFP